MRQFLFASIALGILAMPSVGQAADLPVQVPVRPAPVPVLFSWTGFYLGANLGGGWAQRNITDAFNGLTFSRTSDAAFIGGGQGGFNYQINSFVMGVEGDFDFAARNNRSNLGVVIPALGTIQVSSNSILLLATVAARFGLAFDHLLLYGKAGGGWIGNNNYTITNLTTGAAVTDTNSRSNSGLLAGVGIEYVFGNNVTAKLEYDYLSLSNHTFVVPVRSAFLAGDTFTDHSRNIQMIKVGLNYLFNANAAY